MSTIRRRTRSVVFSDDWLKPVTTDETITILLDFAWSHCKESGPFRDVLGDFLRNRDWDGLCNFKLDYKPGLDAVHLVHARQCLAFFQKFESLPLGIDKKRAASSRFEESESECRLTNRVLKLVRSGEFCFPVGVDAVISLAQRKIAQALGPLPSMTELNFGFGPGATTTTPKRYSCWAIKLSNPLECSVELVPSLSAVANQLPIWFFSQAHACGPESAYADVKVGTGKLEFVPKNAKTYRSVIVEPVLNGVIQRGYGLYIREKLRRVGIYLDDQSRNQQLALRASIDDSLATVDLSMASDTVSRELIFELLPLDWAFALSNCRTSFVAYRGIERPYPLEKFSSMGNGFTFELESLIFWALAHSVLKQVGASTADLAVYGDDIILPSEAYPLLERVLVALGFKVNTEKSYVKGPFRESCGSDYYLGTSIRPWFCKGPLTGESLFGLHNFYMRSFDFERAKKVRKLIPSSLLIFGPDGYGDGHLVGDWTPVRHKQDRIRGWEGTYFQTLVHRPARLKRVPGTDWALPTYVAEKRGGTGENLAYDSNVVAGSNGWKSTLVYTFREGIFLS